MDQFLDRIEAFLPSLVAALAILIVGYLIAWVASTLTRKVLHRTRIDDRLGRAVSSRPGEKPIATEDWAGRIVFWLIMLFVIVAVLNTLSLPAVAGPLGEILATIAAFVPKLIGALVLVALAWVVATALRMLVVRGLGSLRIDQRIGAQADPSSPSPVNVTKPLGDAVYWLVFLLFLPMILDTLELGGLLAPVQSMLTEIMNFLPNLLVAAIILLVGWFVARIIQRVVSSLLAAIGADHLAARLGINKVLGTQRLSNVLGTIVYVLVLMPVLIAALDALGLDAITQPASNMLNTILNAIPDIFAAGLVLVLSYVVGRVVAGLVATLLQSVGFDAMMQRAGLGGRAGARQPSEIVGGLVLVAIMLFAAVEALNLLGFEALAALVGQFIIFAAQIVVGLVIFAIGLYLANLAYRTISSGNNPQATLLANAAQVAILVLAGAMALRQMGLAEEIVNLAFGLLLGAIAVAVALAFGLGGRDVAADLLKRWRDRIDAGDVQGMGPVGGQKMAQATSAAGQAAPRRPGSGPLNPDSLLGSAPRRPGTGPLPDPDAPQGGTTRRLDDEPDLPPTGGPPPRV